MAIHETEPDLGEPLVTVDFEVAPSAGAAREVWMRAEAQRVALACGVPPPLFLKGDEVTAWRSLALRLNARGFNVYDGDERFAVWWPGSGSCEGCHGSGLRVGEPVSRKGLRLQVVERCDLCARFTGDDAAAKAAADACGASLHLFDGTYYIEVKSGAQAADERGSGRAHASKSDRERKAG